MSSKTVRIVIAAVCVLGIGLLVWSLVASLGRNKYNEQGVKALEAGELEEAIGYFDKAVQSDPDSAPGYYNLGLTYSEMAGDEPCEELDKAVKNFDKATELDPECADAYYNRGLAYCKYFHRYEKLPGDTFPAQQEEYFKNAIADFAKCLEIDSEYDLAHAGMGNAYYRYEDSYEGWKDNAIPAYGKAIENKSRMLDADGAEAVSGVYASQARTYLAMNDVEKAYEDYAESLSLDPTMETSLEHQAFVALELGKVQEAYDRSTEYLDISGDSDEADLALSPAMLSAYQLEKYDEVIQYADQITKNFPESGYVGEAYRYKGEVYRLRGEEDEAVRNFQEGVDVCTGLVDNGEDVELPGAHYERALNYMALGQLDSAISDLEWIIGNPQMSDREVAHMNYYVLGHMALSCAYSQAGNNEGAVKTLEELQGLLKEPGRRTTMVPETDRLLGEARAGQTLALPMLPQVLGM